MVNIQQRGWAWFGQWKLKDMKVKAFLGSVHGFTVTLYV